MKKYTILFFLALTVMFSAATVVWGQDLTQQIANQAGYGSVTSSSLAETVGKIIKIILGLLGTIFLVLTVYAGFLWMTAAGNGEQTEKAVGILKTATVGLLIILASYSITYFVLDKIFQATA
jgi:TRAP-type C4-dicarboxylate transport system permease small subunit